MNLYDKKLNDLIDRFKHDVAALTLNKDSVIRMGYIKDVLDAHQIEGYVTATVKTDGSLTNSIYMRSQSDDAILRALQITCINIGASYESIVPNDDINCVSYGFEIPAADGTKFVVSLYDLRHAYSPLDLDRLLKDLKADWPGIPYDVAAAADTRAIAHIRFEQGMPA